MRKLIVIGIVVFVVAACSVSRQQRPSAIGLVPLENYYVPMNNSRDTGYSYQVFTNQADFDREVLQGISAAVTRRPDFSGQLVVAVIHRGAPNQRKDMVMDSATMAGKQMNVYYHVKETQTSTVTTFLPGLALATVPKAKSVKDVSFYEDGVLVKTVPVTIY